MCIRMYTRMRMHILRAFEIFILVFSNQAIEIVRLFLKNTYKSAYKLGSVEMSLKRAFC